MKTLEINDWVLVNNIIYNIHTTEELLSMREQLLRQLNLVLDFDSAVFYLSAMEGDRLREPVLYNCSEEQLDDLLELDSMKTVMHSGNCLVYRETDVIAEEERRNTKHCRQIYGFNNWDYCLHMVLSYHKVFLGVIYFYRGIGKDNFQNNDIFVMGLLKEHLAYRLFRDRKEQGNQLEKLTASQATEVYHLTKREHMILKLLMQGKDNKQLCEELCISVNTLKKHILNIYRKLGIKNRVQMFKLIKEKDI